MLKEERILVLARHKGDTHTYLHRNWHMMHLHASTAWQLSHSQTLTAAPGLSLVGLKRSCDKCICQPHENRLRTYIETLVWHHAVAIAEGPYMTQSHTTLQEHVSAVFLASFLSGSVLIILTQYSARASIFLHTGSSLYYLPVFIPSPPA